MTWPDYDRAGSGTRAALPAAAMVFKDWDQRTAQAVDVSWEGTISRNTKFYLVATLADHPQLDKFTCAHGKFYWILSDVSIIM